MAQTAAIVAATMKSSSYRVKFDRTNFLQLTKLANPQIIYRRKNMYFFAYDGFVMYSDQCQASDFTEQILDTIEFSNETWSK